MNQAEQYIRRVQWHQNHCEWFPAWIYDKDGFANSGTRPVSGDRICFELHEGLVFFGRVNYLPHIIDCWETKPGEFADSYAWESVAKWCYETEDHPGIPVVRTYPM